MARRTSHDSRGEFVFDLVCFLIGGAAALWSAWRIPGPLAPLYGVIGAALLGGGLLLWNGRSWARWVVAVATALFGATLVGRIVADGVTVFRLLGVLTASWVAWDAVRKFRPVPEEPSEPMTSVALWLRKPRYLDASLLARYLGGVWGRDFKVLHPDDPKPSGGDGVCWVGGRSPILMAGTPQGLFAVHNHDRPYVDGSVEEAGESPDLRTEKMLRECRAWMAVDYMGGPLPDRRDAYPWIAKLVAELSGPDVLAVYLPEQCRLLPWTDEMEEQLRSADVLTFFETEQPVPVLRVDGASAALQEAQAEALRRWPEFVEAFRAGAGEDFSVKAAVTRAGVTEHIWVTVGSIDGDAVRGRLGNDPVDLEGLRLGSEVEVALAEVEDWAFQRDGEMVGAFTAAVVAAAYGKGGEQA